MMRNRKRRKVTTSTTTPPSSSPPLHTTTTTIASLPDDIVADILLRLPSAAAIYRAVLASAHWARVAACPTFLRRLRGAHDDYPLLLGHFVSTDGHTFTPPHFLPVPLHHSPGADGGVLAAMVRRGDFFLTRTHAQGSAGRHVLEDCSAGLLLLSDSSGALRVFDLMTHRVSAVDKLPRRGGRDQDHRGRTLCLLPNGDGADAAAGAFRVMSLQHRSGRKLRLEVYDSCTRAWRVLPGAGIPARNHLAQICCRQYSPAMHAGDRIYWKYDASNRLLSLDTKTMTFSDVSLPPGVSRHSAYAVGEAEDGTCCLVHAWKGQNAQLQVWHLKFGDHHGGSGTQMWELERQVPLLLASASACHGVDQIRAIVGGIVLLCFNSSSSYQHHIAFRLKSFKVEADFTCRGLARPFVIE